MSDNDSGGVTSRVTPKRGRAALSDLTLIVRPPGRPLTSGCSPVKRSPKLKNMRGPTVVKSNVCSSRSRDLNDVSSRESC